VVLEHPKTLNVPQMIESQWHKEGHLNEIKYVGVIITEDTGKMEDDIQTCI